VQQDGMVALLVECRTCDQEVLGSAAGWAPWYSTGNLGQVTHNSMPWSPSNIWLGRLLQVWWKVMPVFLVLWADLLVQNQLWSPMLIQQVGDYLILLWHRFWDTGKQLVQRYSRGYHGGDTTLVVFVHSDLFSSGSVGILSAAGGSGTRRQTDAEAQRRNGVPQMEK